MSAEFALTSYPLAPPVRSVNFLEFVYVLTQRVAWWQPYFFIKLDRKEIVHKNCPAQFRNGESESEQREQNLLLFLRWELKSELHRGPRKFETLKFVLIYCQKIYDLENFHIECFAIATMHNGSAVN